jgi:methyl-accepting chemotaxis protein
VSDLIAEIAAASEEQDAGIQQVNTAVTQMDQVVQQNASLVEEAAAATESMKSQAGALLQMVARFNLGDGQQADAAAPATARPQSVPETTAPQPIALKPAPKVLPVLKDALAPATRPSANGDWKEF